jgi:hypothetical protein
MWVQILFLNFSAQLLYFKKNQNFVLKLYAEYFLCQYFLKNLSFLFSIFYKFDHIIYLFYNFSIRIFCI